MWKIAICDDDAAFAAKLQTLWRSYAAVDHREGKFFVFTDAQHFLSSGLEDYDLVFLDVCIGASNGMDVAQTFRQANPHAVLIFVSGYAQYVFQGYTFRAFRYLLKDDIAQTFPKCVREAVKQLSIKPKLFPYRTTDGMDAICRFSEILYFESLSHNVMIHLNTQPPASPVIHTTLTTLAEKLSDPDFLRIQRSYMVNMRSVVGVKRLEITLSNGEVLTCSRQKIKQVIRRYLEIQGGMV